MTTALPDVSQAPYIIDKAESLSLNLRVLYEAVIDLSSEGLITANCINMAAGILLNDLGLPAYFFENITKDSLKQILSSITSSISVQDNRVVLVGRVAHIDFDLEHGNDVQRVRIATRETRDSMEKLIETLISGHRREYYYSRENEYYTYIIRPETVQDFTKAEFQDSPFLFNLAGDFTATPEPTRMRYETFLKKCRDGVTPMIEAFNLPMTGETRFMFNSDFATPQIPIFRRLFQDHGLTLMRAYWEPYWDDSEVPTSICSLYSQGEISRAKEADIIRDLQDVLAFNVGPVTDLYVKGQLSFREMLFAGNAMDFTQMFIFSESEDTTDRGIMSRLGCQAYEDAFAARIHRANRATFDARTVRSTAMAHPDLIQFLHRIFEKRFNPTMEAHRAILDLDQEMETFLQMLRARFMDFPLGREIFSFMSKMVTTCLKTNFYKPGKRAYSFRFDHQILDPLVYNQQVFGIFFVNGHYALATHMRAGDIARGGIRLVKTTAANYDYRRDNAVLLNFALGPRAQHLKHKDICESGAAGIVIPHAVYREYGSKALFDFTEGILDLMLPDPTVVDHYGRPEILFFGPDQGTSAFMDDIAQRARERGYPHWRTLATGKKVGIPHNTYGLLDNGKLFGILKTEEGEADLQINGKSVLVTSDMEKLRKKIGGKIQTCGMTTTAIMAAFHSLIEHEKTPEEQLNLMVIGGPDGCLNGNELLCYQGRICLAIDNHALLYDPTGLDRPSLEKLALAGRIRDGVSALDFPAEKLSPEGFKIEASGRHIRLPDGSLVEDGSLFHRNFLFDPACRPLIKEARIEVCIPCGGYKEGIHRKNVQSFLDNFQELRFIVEGANLFFDDAARRHIADTTAVKQIKDATANKGGVVSSSVAEVLTGFLFNEDYESRLMNEVKTRCALIRDILDRVETCTREETALLLGQHRQNPGLSLSALSDRAGEEILSLQDRAREKLNALLRQKTLVWKVMEAYIPKVLIKTLGKKQIMAILNADHMQEYRDAVITKKLASMAFYKFGMEWETFQEKLDQDFSKTMAQALK